MMCSLSTNLLGAPDLNPYFPKDCWCQSEQTKFLCAALARSWGRQQHRPLQSTKQINTLDTVKKFNTVSTGHNNHVQGRMLEQVRRWCFMRQPFILKARTQKRAEATVHSIYLF